MSKPKNCPNHISGDHLIIKGTNECICGYKLQSTDLSLEQVVYKAMEMADSGHQIPCEGCAKGIAGRVKEWIASQLPDPHSSNTREYKMAWFECLSAVKQALLGKEEV